MVYKALILAGGEGTRLRPLTLKIPKPCLPILNKPFIFYQLDLIENSGIKECLILSGYKSEILKNFIEEKYKNLKIKIIEEREPMGTGGAIGAVKNEIEDGAVVFNGDVLFEINLIKIIEDHKKRKADGTILTIKVKDPSRYGVIKTKKGGKILEFLEKIKNPPSKWINAGLYVLEKNLLLEIPEKPSSIEREIFPALLRKGFNIFSQKYYGYWKDIGTIESYRQANFDLAKGKLKIWENQMKENRILSDLEDVKIDGVSIVGRNCKIGGGTKIKKSIIMDNCEIGRNCKILNSVIFFNSKLKDNSEIIEEVFIEN